MTTVSVVIPARDAAATLGDALDALAAQRDVDPAEVEVLVVDDGSADGTAPLAEGHRLAPRVLRGAGAGPAAARNLGAAHARGRVLAFTDADCAPAPSWLRAVLDAVQAGADLVVGPVGPPPGVPVGPWDRTLVVRGELLYETANLACRRELFERLGGFESWLRPARGKELGEDVLFGWRARREGAVTAWEDAARVHHAVFPRGPGGWIAERRRLRFFPALVRRVPELRDALCWHRVFLGRRGAAVDAALLGLLLATAGRRRTGALVALPYVVLLASDARGRDPRGAVVHGAAEVVADVVGAVSLAEGSLRARTLLL